MAKRYHCKLHVRGYELDSFGHVNHAVYISYLEHARWELLAEENISLQDFQKWKRWPVISEIQCQFLKPCFMGDLLDVRTQIVDHGKVNFVFEQVIYKKDTPVFRATVRSVMVNENGRPADIPKEVEKLWSDQNEGGGI